MSLSRYSIAINQLLKPPQRGVLLGLIGLLPLTLILAGCVAQQVPPVTVKQPIERPTSPIHFTDTTESAGIKFRHTSGAFGISLQPETMGNGVTFFDYDNDGYPDLFFVNSRNWTDAELAAWQKGKWTRRELADFARSHLPGTLPVRQVPTNRPRDHVTGALYHNNHNATFTDVTLHSGLDIEMYGMGVAAGDYDNDGKTDLYVTGYGRNYLFHNESTSRLPKFREVATQAGVRDRDWSSSAAWIDYDKDGLLDLFVCRFLQWTPATDIYGSSDGVHKGYVRPIVFKGLASHLYHNQGHGKFKEVSAQAGVAQESKGLAVATCDYNADGWPDIIVANDGLPTFLFRNNHNGTFTEVGARTGIALSTGGMARAGMGLDTADIDHSDRDSVVVSNFAEEMVGLYYNKGNGIFADVAPETGVGEASKRYLAWGIALADVNNDGWPDLLVANGHVNDQYNISDPGVTQAQRPLLFINDAHGVFRESGLSVGPAMQKPMVARGLACADIDLDGDLDVIFTTNNGPVRLLRNDTAPKNNVIRLVLQGSRSNRSAIGTLVKVKLAEHDGLRRWVRSGSSYLSQSELPLTLGLGSYTKALIITIHWPSGAITQFHNIAANQVLIVNEGNSKARMAPLNLPVARQ